MHDVDNDSFAAKHQAQAGLSVLVVEDDFATRRQLIMKLAEDASLQVEVGASVSEGLSWIAQRHFDVILLDLGLPDGSGLAIIDAACVRENPPQILVLSAMRDEASVVTAISAGAGGYIVKDAASEDILQAIYNLSAGFSPLSPSIARFILRSFRQAEKRLPVAPTSKVEQQGGGDGAQMGLTTREHAVLLEITRGASYKQISRTLAITEATVQSHIKNIYRKLGVTNRSEASFRFNQIKDT